MELLGCMLGISKSYAYLVRVMLIVRAILITWLHEERMNEALF